MQFFRFFSFKKFDLDQDFYWLIKQQKFRHITSSTTAKFMSLDSHGLIFGSNACFFFFCSLPSSFFFFRRDTHQRPPVSIKAEWKIIWMDGNSFLLCGKSVEITGGLNDPVRDSRKASTKPFFPNESYNRLLMRVKNDGFFPSPFWKHSFLVYLFSCLFIYLSIYSFLVYLFNYYISRTNNYKLRTLLGRTDHKQISRIIRLLKTTFEFRIKKYNL